MEILVFPKVLEATGAIWQPDKVVLVSGKISDKDGVFKLLADSVKSIDIKEVEKFRRILETQKKNGQKPVDPFIETQHAASQNGTPRKLVISLPGNADKEILKNMSQFFDRCSLGSMKVYLDIGNSRLETPYCIDHFDGLEDKLRVLVPDGKIYMA